MRSTGVVGALTVFLAYAILSAGHLPLMVQPISRKHPSRDALFQPKSRLDSKTNARNHQIIAPHEVLSILKQALSASRDMIISSQICFEVAEGLSH